MSAAKSIKRTRRALLSKWRKQVCEWEWEKAIRQAMIRPLHIARGMSESDIAFCDGVDEELNPAPARPF